MKKSKSLSGFLREGKAGKDQIRIIDHVVETLSSSFAPHLKGTMYTHSSKRHQKVKRLPPNNWIVTAKR
jgi:hypothetical protein